MQWAWWAWVWAALCGVWVAALLVREICRAVAEQLGWRLPELLVLAPPDDSYRARVTVGHLGMATQLALLRIPDGIQTAAQLSGRVMTCIGALEARVAYGEPQRRAMTIARELGCDSNEVVWVDWYAYRGGVGTHVSVSIP